ncbi:MAG: GNAT family N-acetyltransferase [Christensenellales bacterium]
MGFCCGQVFRSICYENHHAEITELFVREEYRRRGVGARLIAFMEAEFYKQGIRHFQLFTGASNAAAQAFYHSCGYRATDEVMFRKKPPENS